MRAADVRSIIKRTSIAALDGVGHTDWGEWWYWNRVTSIGHLRVPITWAEHLQVGDGIPGNDAGQAGTYTKTRSVLH